MFVSKRRFLRMQRLCEEYKRSRDRHMELESEYWDKYIAYKLLYSEARKSQSTSSQFSQEELKRLVSLCHPDKHSNSKAANEMTAKLLELIKKR